MTDNQVIELKKAIKYLNGKNCKVRLANICQETSIEIKKIKIEVKQEQIYFYGNKTKKNGIEFLTNLDIKNIESIEFYKIDNKTQLMIAMKYKNFAYYLYVYYVDIKQV
jgi:hypothetical protein